MLRAIVLAVTIAFFIVANRAPGFAESPPPVVTGPSPSWGHSATVTNSDGDPIFTVDGKPFFVWGASFFYERLPRDQWEISLNYCAALGFNTIDLYLPWNWHEIDDGDFDFGGTTNPRRDLRGLIDLLRKADFKIILRPGPVVRNEWRNGGYPSWLLVRPEYGMSAHEILEGRYPATATFQNAHSDDAAAEWMNNATHVRYSARWLQTVLHEFAPVADKVIAIQLDDDQAAYIDNQTYPAPHLHAYLAWLQKIVHGATAPGVPVYINTYQPKVPSSLPVWQWGNWYQGGSLQIGEHDLNDLEFSTMLLQTQRYGPLMQSEFQAGWLAAPEDQLPRPSSPSSTTLALTKLIALGVKGIVDFPPQDSLAPAGWEAPFTNWFYSWDAAVPYEPGGDELRPDRYAPTSGFGGQIRVLSAQLAAAHRVTDGAIAYVSSAYTSLPPERLGRIENSAAAGLAQCGAAGLTCDLIDLRSISARKLRSYRFLIVPHGLLREASDPVAKKVYARALTMYASAHPHSLFENVPNGMRPASGFAGATLLKGPGGARYIIAINPGDRAKRIANTLIEAHGASILAYNVDLSALSRSFRTGDRIVATTCPIRGISNDLISFALTERTDGRYTPCDVEVDIGHIRSSARLDDPVPADIAVGDRSFWRAIDSNYGHSDHPAKMRIGPNLDVLESSSDAPKGDAVAYQNDLLRDGFRAVTLQNALVRLVVDPSAGARAFVFQDRTTKRNIFNMTGALRDDVARQIDISQRDYIAAYTHSYPAGTFNRPYDVAILESGKRAVVRLSYAMPDALPAGARFEKTLTLEANSREFTMRERVTFAGDDTADPQHGVSLASLSAGQGAPVDWVTMTAPTGMGVYDPKSQTLATVVWKPSEMEGEELKPYRSSITLFLRYASNVTATTRYGVFAEATEDDARRRFAAVSSVAGLP